jgi:RNA ligase (TIGR02306 family)
VKVGDDVTKILNVIKYEPDMPANLRGNIKSRKVNWLRGKLYKYFPFFFKHRPTSTTFPPFLQKTDETRVQSIPKIFDEIRGMDVYITEKLDGTSVTYYLNGKEFGVCSRNFELQESKDNTYWQIAKEYDIKNKLKEYLKTTNYKGIAIQGEIIGEGIQKNPLGIKGKKLFIFNLYHINTKSYASFDELKDFGKIMEIPMVPILEHRARVDMFWDVSKLIEMAKGNSVLNPKVKREGIVVRTMLDTYSHVMKGRMSFKAINNDYLLSGGE